MKLLLITLLGAIVLVAGCVSSIPFLNNEPPSFMVKCTSNSDCAAVSAFKDCCNACKDATINKQYEAEWNYANEKYCQAKNETCTIQTCGHGSNPLCISEKCMINKTAVE